MNWWVLRRSIHVSWLIATLSLGVIVGIILAQNVPSDLFYSISWLLVGVCLAMLGLWRRKIYMILPIMLAGGLIGLWRGSISQQDIAPYKHFVGHEAVVAGNISEDPDIGSDGTMTVRLTNIQIDGHEMAGSVWASVTTKLELKRSDQLTIRGKLNPGFGSFSTSIYRATFIKDQRPEPGDVARQVRDWFADGVRKAVPEPQSSLGIGYLVGQRSALPTDLDSALRIAGLTHVVVASGYNLTILVRLARRLFVKVSKYLSALSAGGMIVAFMAVTGLSPSMSRAGLVAGLSLFAWYYGRKFHPLVLLPLAAAITLLVNPSYGWNDLGWQLSFAAFAGVMIVGPLLQAYFYGNEKPGIIRQIVGETIAAEICTLPILVMAFGQFSNVALLANLLILPLVPLAMLLTFIAGVSALSWPAATDMLGVPAHFLLQYMTSVAQYLAGLPWAQTKLTINGALMVGYYVVVVVLLVYIWRKTKYSLRESNIVE